LRLNLETKKTLGVYLDLFHYLELKGIFLNLEPKKTLGGYLDLFHFLELKGIFLKFKTKKKHWVVI